MAYISSSTTPKPNARRERLADESSIAASATTSNRYSAWEATDKELRLQARCADLEYQLAVKSDELKDMSRERDRYKLQLDQMATLNKARQEAVDAITGGGGGGQTAADGTNYNESGTAGRTLRDIQRASIALNKSAAMDEASALTIALGNFSSTLGAPSIKSNGQQFATATNPEEVYRLQAALIEANEARADAEKQLQKTQAALKVIQDTAIEEVGRAKMGIEKEVISLKMQLETATAKQHELKRTVLAADQVLATEFHLEGMSQFISHSVLIPSEAVFQRLRASYKNNRPHAASQTRNGAASGLNSTNLSMDVSSMGVGIGGGTFQGKYDVNIEFSAATRSVILKGKRLCVELLKGELYATLNSLTMAQVAAATGAPTVAALGHHQTQLTTPGLGNGGARQLSANSRKDTAAEVDHLCRTISTHEATIAALHTAIQHSQDRAKLADSQTEEAKLHVSFVEEKIKQTQILCTAKEREITNESSNLRDQLKFAEDKVEKALRSLQDEANVSSHYRDENDRLREELESVLTAKEMSDRTGYVASEQVKALTTRADQATKTASLAIADKEHADRLQKEIVKVRAEAETKADRLTQEVGQLQFQLKEKETVASDIKRQFKDYEIALETSNTEIEVQRELINELRNRLLLALNAGTASAAGTQHQSSSIPSLGRMSNVELLQKLSVPVSAKNEAAGTGLSRSRAGSGIIQHGSSSENGGLNLTPRTGNNPNASTATHHHQSINQSAASASLGGGQVAAVPNDVPTMQIIEDLYVENDSLKAELAQSHKDIREVAHALKETRDIREHSVKEVERLQLEKQKWSEEKVAVQRAKMEEQLAMRQKISEYDLVVATLKDQLAQTKARCELLQKKVTGVASAGPVPSASSYNSSSQYGSAMYEAGRITPNPEPAAASTSTSAAHSPNTLSVLASSRLAALAEGSQARHSNPSYLSATSAPTYLPSAPGPSRSSVVAAAVAAARQSANETGVEGRSWLMGNSGPAYRQEPSIEQPKANPPTPSSRFL